MAMGRVLNIAHRGARSLAPENTLAAARAALLAGADMWETDVGITRDEVLILFHDDSLTRTTDAQTVFPHRPPWVFTTFSYGELRRLDAGSWFNHTDPFGQIKSGAIAREELERYRGEKIPTLEEALIFTRDAGWRINIELKQLPAPLDRFPVVEHVLALIEKLRIETGHFVISSFNLDWIRKVRRLRPDIEVQAVVGYSEDTPIRWGSLEFETYNARHSLVSEARVGALAAKGVALNVWAVNEERDMQRFIRAGVAGIITDFPQRLTRFRNKPI